MRNLLKSKQALIVASLAMVVVVGFQNCSPVRFSYEELASSNLDPAIDVSSDMTCFFNGRTYQQGEEVSAFFSSTVPAGETCQMEKRVCQKGAFTGSFNYAFCNPGAYRACLFVDGRTVAHGDSVTAYQNSSVGFGNLCVSESRVCNDGVLSGSYNYPECHPGDPASCPFDRKIIPHGGETTAFFNSTLPYGQNCNASSNTEVRHCQNGALDGTAPHGSCANAAAQSCSFDGKTLAHNAEVTAFFNSTLPYGQDCRASANTEVRRCNNGTLSGTAPHPNCSNGAAKSCTFLGRTLAHGEEVTAFIKNSLPSGQNCNAATNTEVRRCDNGTLTGSAKYNSCANTGQSCSLQGETIRHGGSIQAFFLERIPYSSAVMGDDCGNSDRNEIRICNNGILSGSAPYIECDIDFSGSVDGTCGFSHLQTLSSPPSSGLCSRGTSSSVISQTSQYKWTCYGAGGGSSASCSATRTTTPVAVNGVCGSAQNGSYSSAPSTNLCSQGSVSSVSTSTSSYSWTCSGTNGGNIASCLATRTTTPAAVNGVCGSAQNGSYSSAPSTNLCSQGSVSSVSTSTSGYSWTCSGTNGGNIANCSATHTVVTDPKSCPAGLYLNVRNGVSTCDACKDLTVRGTNNTASGVKGVLLKRNDGSPVCVYPGLSIQYLQNSAGGTCEQSLPWIGWVNGTPSQASYGLGNYPAPQSTTYLPVIKTIKCSFNRRAADIDTMDCAETVQSDACGAGSGGGTGSSGYSGGGVSSSPL